ncbi:MAG: cyclic nucleotide-binding domain-containing protein [Pseudomonadota bacterium]
MNLLLRDAASLGLPEINVSEFPFVLGRGLAPFSDLYRQSATLRNLLKALSRRHAQLTRANGVACLTDLGSTNGTWLNGTPVTDQPVPLGDGDVIRLAGILAYQVRLEQQASPVPPSPPEEDQPARPQAGDEIFGRVFGKGEVVFRQGDQGDHLYIIQSGAVEISRVLGGGPPATSILLTGDFFGELALVDQRPRSATATAIDDTRLLPLSRGSVLRRAVSDPGLITHLIKTLCLRLENTNQALRVRVRGDAALRQALAAKADPDQPPAAGPDLPSPLPPAPSMLGLEFSSQQVEPGFVLCREGDPGGSLFIISEGSVEISQDSGGAPCLLARLGPGDFFGEMALFTGRPRVATAKASTACSLVEVKAQDFWLHLQKEPQLGLVILQTLILRLRAVLAALESPRQALDTIRRSMPPAIRQERRVRLALVSLSSCGGCQATILNQPPELARLLERAEIAYCPMLMDQESLPEVDIALVDGVVRVQEDQQVLAEVRAKSRFLLAWGTCAAFGGLPALANLCEVEDLMAESYASAQDPFAYYLSASQGQAGQAGQGMQAWQSGLLRRAGKLDDLVKVDYYLPGCPPPVAVLENLLKELRGEPVETPPRAVLCGECPRKPAKGLSEGLRISPTGPETLEHCFLSQGVLCLGFLTRGGCGAPCSAGGLPCWGCRGPSEAAMKKVGGGEFFEDLLISSLARRCKLEDGAVKAVVRLLRQRGHINMGYEQKLLNDRARLR